MAERSSPLRDSRRGPSGSVRASAVSIGARKAAAAFTPPSGLSAEPDEATAGWEKILLVAGLPRASAVQYATLWRHVPVPAKYTDIPFNRLLAIEGTPADLLNELAAALHVPRYGTPERSQGSMIQRALSHSGGPQEKTERVRHCYALDCSNMIADNADVVAAIAAAMRDYDGIDNMNLSGNRLTSEGFTRLVETAFASVIKMPSCLDLSCAEFARFISDVTLCLVNDLDDTVVQIILQQYRATGIEPREVLLRGNRFTTNGIGRFLTALQSLRSLDFSCNPIEQWHSLNTPIFRLLSLQRLNVSYTNLKDEDFGRLLKHLPRGLVHLSLQGNRIVDLGPGIAVFTSLTCLDMSRNKLERISNQLLKLREDCHLDLVENPHLIYPPKLVAQAGAAAIRKWLSTPGSNGELDTNVRVFMLGTGGSGKTTLARSLYQHSFLPGGVPASFSKLTASSQSSSLAAALNPLKSQETDRATMKLIYVDLPGNLEDSRVYLPFLSRYNAIYVIVASVSSSAAPGSTQLLAELKSSFSYWLSALSRHVGVAPGTRSASTLSWRIQLVCTKCDSAGDAGLLQKVSDELMQWARVTFGHLPIAEKLLPVTLREVSAVSRSINSLAADVTREEVALVVYDFYRQVAASLPALASNTPVMLLRALQNALVLKAPQLGAYGPFMWRQCFSYLHNTGVLLADREFNSVCLVPDAILPLLAIAASRSSKPGRLCTVVSAEYISMANGMRTEPLPELVQWTLERVRLLLVWLQAWQLTMPISDREHSATDLDAQTSFYFPSLRRQAELDLRLSPPSKSGFFSGARFPISDRYVLNELFFNVQQRLRPIAWIEYDTFTNLMFLLDDQDTVAKLSRHQTGIDVVVAGATPRQLVERIAQIVTAEANKCMTSVESVPLCGSTGLNSVVLDGSRCERGHVLPAQELEKGSACDAEQHRFNVLWTPSEHGEFYSSGKWKSEKGSTLRTTVLTEDEKHASRRLEYSRARNLFYRFISKDSIQGFALEQVVFLDNSELEGAFQNVYESFYHRTLRSESVKRDLEQTQEDPSRQQWRQWMRGRFDAYEERVSGNDRINLVVAWHGTSEENTMKIAEKNFRDPQDVAAANKKTDPGYYGSGIYFTQYPSYSDKWLLMGKPYPVIESPFEPNNFLGKPCKSGFDSHYVSVRNQGNAHVYLPCPTTAEPDYDELIVFHKAQILPRYVLYYKRVGGAATGAPTTLLRESLVDFRLGDVKLTKGTSKARIILWVEEFNEQAELALKLLSSSYKNVTFVRLTSTSELMVWLSTNFQAQTGGDTDSVRVVTSRSRARDGGPDAARKLVHTLRHTPVGARLQVLIYCHDWREVKDLTDKNTSASSDPIALRTFCSW